MLKCVEGNEEEEGGACPSGNSSGPGPAHSTGCWGWGRALGSHRGEMFTISGFCLVRGHSLPKSVLPWGMPSDEGDCKPPRELSTPLQTQIASEISVWLFSSLDAGDTRTLK